MIRSVPLCLLVAVVLANVHPHSDPIISHAPLTYKVNIDDPPEVRWLPFVQDFEVPLKKFMDYFDLIPFPKGFFNGVEWYAKNEFIYKDFVAEVDALAKISGYPFEKIFFINFMYEFSTMKACTGIIVRTAEGNIWHGRNLDFSMWELLSNLVANIEYYRNGKLLFTVDTIIGSVFTLTANKPGAFSVEVNTRTEARFEDDFVSFLIHNDIPTCWFLRKVVQEQTTYAGAVQRLKTQKLAAPVYFVVSGLGPNDGAVIERDAEKVHGFYELTDKNWFIVQTNYDRDVPDPFHDLRRIPAEQKLTSRGNKNFTEQVLFDVLMSKFPTLNIETILTVVMSSARGYHNTTVWYGQNPKTETNSLQKYI